MPTSDLQLRVLVGTADELLAASHAWGELAARGGSTHGFRLAPVGSNVPDERGSRSCARDSLHAGPDTVVCVTINASAPNQLIGHVSAAVEAIRDSGFDVIHLNLGRAVAPLPLPGVRSVAPGRMPADELARLLSAADICLAAYPDGISTRRTTVMAALQHGIATVATGPSEHAELFAGAVALVEPEDRAGFAHVALRLAGDAGARSELSLAARRLFERSFDDSVIVAPYLTLLS